MTNAVIENMVNRRSIRKYKPEQIKDEELQAVIKAGEYAPTGMGMQSPKMVVVQDKETIKLLSDINAKIMGVDSDPFYGAPTVIVVFADKACRPTYVEDGSLVLGNLMNAAHSVGLGSCWIHRAKETFETPEGKELMKKWGIADTCVGIGNCVLGYADMPMPEPKERKKDYVVMIK